MGLDGLVGPPCMRSDVRGDLLSGSGGGAGSVGRPLLPPQALQEPGSVSDGSELNALAPESRARPRPGETIRAHILSSILFPVLQRWGSAVRFSGVWLCFVEEEGREKPRRAC